MSDGPAHAAPGHRLAGEFAFATFLIAFVGWYFLDASTTSTSVENLILILPVSALCLVLYLVIVAGLWRCRASGAAAGPMDAAAPHDSPDEKTKDRRAVALMGLTCLYVGAMAYLPFDLVTVVYLAMALWLNGERRWPVVGLYSVSFGLFVVLGFQAMLSIPFPTLLPFEP
jgi:putative tricarboxylic transport membrane protein